MVALEQRAGSGAAETALVRENVDCPKARGPCNSEPL